MAKKPRKAAPTPSPTSQEAAAPQIFAANLEGNGAVKRVGGAITQDEGQRLRKAGQNVVVCGPDLAANRALAKAIE